MYLSSDDLNKYIYQDVLNSIIEEDDNRVESAINDAIAEVVAYLQTRYNMVEILAKTGDARNAMLVRICKDIAMYHLHSMLKTMPAMRVKKYDDARADLKMLMRGELTLAGEPLANSIDNTTAIEIGYGGNTPRKNYF